MVFWQEGNKAGKKAKGTFDVSLLTIEEGVFEVKATAVLKILSLEVMTLTTNLRENKKDISVRLLLILFFLE